MQPLKRTSLVDLAEDALVSAIRRGQLAERLPGIRPLSKAMNVNHLTLAAAIKRLAGSGWLVSEGPKRRYRIVSKDRVPASSPSRKPVLFLSPKPLSLMPEAMELIAEFMLKNPDLEVRDGVWGEPGGRPETRRWDGLVETTGAGHLVVFSGTPEIASWATARRLPTIFVGGYCRDIGLPSIGINLQGLVSIAIKRLASLGHSDIILLTAGQHPAASAILRDNMGADMAKLRLPFTPERHFLSIQQHDPGMLEDGLRRVFKQRVPTAILLTARQQFATISGLLADYRMTVPRDVSIVLLLPDGLEDWNVPRLAHFPYPVVAEIAKALRNWINHPPANPAERIRLTSDLVEAGSIAAARRGR
jgi:hypothetical protein